MCHVPGGSNGCCYIWTKCASVCARHDCSNFAFEFYSTNRWTGVRMNKMKYWMSFLALSKVISCGFFILMKCQNHFNVFIRKKSQSNRRIIRKYWSSILKRRLLFITSSITPFWLFISGFLVKVQANRHSEK